MGVYGNSFRVAAILMGSGVCFSWFKAEEHQDANKASVAQRKEIAYGT